MAPEADDTYEALVLRCFACQTKDHAGTEFAKDEHADTAGLYVAVLDGSRFDVNGDE